MPTLVSNGEQRERGEEYRCSQTDPKEELFNILKDCSAPEITQDTRRRKLFLNLL